jgi:hypothetical protein
MTNPKEFITGADLMKMSFPSLTMLTKFLPSSAFVLVSGMPGAGKTEFLMHQAKEVASKEKILFFCNEGGERNFQLRLKAYCRDAHMLNNLIYERNRWPNFAEVDGIKFLENAIIKFKPKAIFFDPGPDAFGEENDAALLKEPLRNLYDLIHKHQVCAVFSWHPAKNSFVSNVYNFRGSSAIAGKIDMMYDLALQGTKRRLYLHKNRLECPGLIQGQKWSIDMVSNETGRDLTFNDVQEARAAQEEEKRDRLQYVLSQFISDKEYSSTEIVNSLIQTFEGDIKESTAKKYFKEWLKDEQFIQLHPSEGRKPAIYKRVDKELST